MENIVVYGYTAILLAINIALFWYFTMHRIDNVKQKMGGNIVIYIGLATTFIDVIAKISY